MDPQQDRPCKITKGRRMKHTTEPWHVCEPTEALHAVRAEAGRIVADVGYSDTDAQNRMNARRIVACVNACAGVTTEELEQGGFVTGLIERLEEKERQRDALQEELENIATAEWREFDPDTRRCAYEFVLWAQSRARHTLNRVLSGDVTAPLPEDEDKYLAKNSLWGMRALRDAP